MAFDRCVNGQRLNCLTMTDELTKEGLAIDMDGFVSKASLSRIVRQGIGTALISPSALADAEGSNGKFRDDCLSSNGWPPRR